MPAHDAPAALSMPLEHLHLELRQLAQSLEVVRGKKQSVTDLLKTLPVAPDAPLRVVAQALPLDEIGALTGKVGTLTVLGRLMSALPLDGRLCRLLLVGCLLGTPCDAVVMAAGLSVDDPFSRPCPSSATSMPSCAASLRASFEVRRHCDGGHLSEPLALRSLFVAWLSGLAADPAGSVEPDELGRKEAILVCHARRWREMAAKHAVDVQSCMRFSAAVVGVSERMLRFLPASSTAHHKVSALLGLLQPTPAGGAARGPGDMAEEDPVALAREQMLNSSGSLSARDVLCQDPWLLKAVIACAFAPQFAEGRVRASAAGDEGAAQRAAAREMLATRLNPFNSVALGIEGADPKDSAVFDGIKRSLERATGEAGERGPSLALSEGGQLFVSAGEAEPDEECSDTPADLAPVNVLLDPEPEILRPLPPTACLIAGLAGGEPRFQVRTATPPPRPPVVLLRPSSPFELAWEFVQRPGREGPEETVTELGARPGRCGWRGPLGLLASCEAAPDEFASAEDVRMPRKRRAFAVYYAAGVSAGSAAGAPSSLEGVTVLGMEEGGALSAALLIAFLRQQHNLELEVAWEQGTIEAVRLLGSEIRLRTEGQCEVLLVEDIQLINELRQALSVAFAPPESPAADPEGAEQPALQPELVPGLVAALERERAPPQLGAHGAADSLAAVEAALEVLCASLRSPRSGRWPGEAPGEGETEFVQMHWTPDSRGPFRLFHPLNDLSAPRPADAPARAEELGDLPKAKAKIPRPPAGPPPGKRAAGDDAPPAYVPAAKRPKPWGGGVLGPQTPEPWSPAAWSAKGADRGAGTVAGKGACKGSGKDPEEPWNQAAWSAKGKGKGKDQDQEGWVAWASAAFDPQPDRSSGAWDAWDPACEESGGVPGDDPATWWPKGARAAEDWAEPATEAAVGGSPGEDGGGEWAEVASGEWAADDEWTPKRTAAATGGPSAARRGAAGSEWTKPGGEADNGGSEWAEPGAEAAGGEWLAESDGGGAAEPAGGEWPAEPAGGEWPAEPAGGEWPAEAAGGGGDWAEPGGGWPDDGGDEWTKPSTEADAEWAEPGAEAEWAEPGAEAEWAEPGAEPGAEAAGAQPWPAADGDQREPGGSAWGARPSSSRPQGGSQPSRPSSSRPPGSSPPKAAGQRPTEVPVAGAPSLLRPRASALLRATAKAGPAQEAAAERAAARPAQAVAERARAGLEKARAAAAARDAKAAAAAGGVLARPAAGKVPPARVAAQSMLAQRAASPKAGPTAPAAKVPRVDPAVFVPKALGSLLGAAGGGDAEADPGAEADAAAAPPLGAARGPPSMADAKAEARPKAPSPRPPSGPPPPAAKARAKALRGSAGVAPHSKEASPASKRLSERFL